MMKQYSRFITLAGGVLALFSFMLPWEYGYRNSGVEFAQSSFNIITVLFLASFVIVLTCLMLNQHTSWKVKMSKFLVFNCGGIGLFGFFILFFGDSLNIRIDGSSFDELSLGGFVSVVGFILAIYGVTEYPKTLKSSATKDKQEDETNDPS
ncbi:MAG: hypothetical protein OXI43_01105 [Candidatus Poribacteria bacterium]|nr:hypothetical protein [Candidatus Poribacteria bacterium]